MHTRIKAAALAALLASVAMAAGAAENAPYGNAAARADGDLSIQDMLRYAIEDEYLARAEYVAIMEAYGSIRPFSSIKEAETNHIAWITEAYEALGLPAPSDQGARHAILPSSLKEAYETGVQAELDNIAMYERFLGEDEFGGGRNAELRILFENLSRASENHLRAFRNQLARY